MKKFALFIILSLGIVSIVYGSYLFKASEFDYGENENVQAVLKDLFDNYAYAPKLYLYDNGEFNEEVITGFNLFNPGSCSITINDGYMTFKSSNSSTEASYYTNKILDLSKYRKVVIEVDNANLLYFAISNNFANYQMTRTDYGNTLYLLVKPTNIIQLKNGHYKCEFLIPINNNYNAYLGFGTKNQTINVYSLYLV